MSSTILYCSTKVKEIVSFFNERNSKSTIFKTLGVPKRFCSDYQKVSSKRTPRKQEKYCFGTKLHWSCVRARNSMWVGFPILDVKKCLSKTRYFSGKKLMLGGFNAYDGGKCLLLV